MVCIVDTLVSSALEVSICISVCLMIFPFWWREATFLQKKSFHYEIDDDMYFRKVFFSSPFS